MTYTTKKRLRSTVSAKTALLRLAIGREANLLKELHASRARASRLGEEVAKLRAEHSRVVRVVGNNSFAVAVPGARERDPSHNGAHDVVMVSDILDALDPVR